VWISAVFKKNEKSNKSRRRSLPSISLPIHYTLTILPSDVMSSALFTV
jgi:hypothetical protein